MSVQTCGLLRHFLRRWHLGSGCTGWPPRGCGQGWYMQLHETQYKRYKRVKTGIVVQCVKINNWRLSDPSPKAGCMCLSLPVVCRMTHLCPHPRCAVELGCVGSPGSTGPGAMEHPSMGLGSLGALECPHSVCEQDREGMGVPTPRAPVGCPSAKAELSSPPRAPQAAVGPWQSGHGPVPPWCPCHCPVPSTAPGTHWHELRPQGTRGMRG